MRNSFAHRRRAPGAGFFRTAFWDFGSLLCHVTLSWLYRYRVQGESNIPPTGAVIFVANHQSLLDPMIHGLAVGDRAPRPMAKESLFSNPIFGAILRGLGCIPIREQGANRDSMRAALEELAAGRTVMLYPEGTRTPDGDIKKFQRGVELLLRKSNASIVPMGIAGAFDAWPSSRKLPRLSGRIHAAIGRAIPHEEAKLMFADPATGLAELQSRVEHLMQHCRARIAGECEVFEEEVA